MKILPTILLVIVSFSFASCDLDSLLFHQTTLTSYTLSTAVIPESNREFVTMTSQGKKIYGYFIKSNGSSPSITVLYFHGNYDHLQYYWDRAELLYKTGFNVFIFDYQGYGMSEGTLSESALYADSRAALQYVLSRTDVSAKRLAFYGYSVGAAGAIDVAAYEFTPSCLCLECPFASMSTLLQSGVMLDIPSSYITKGEYNNAEKIRKIHAPLLFMHGVDDKFIDIEKNGAVVFNNANPPKQFIRIPGADHEGIPGAMGESNYVSTVKTFIQQHTPSN
ncbi:MAG: alpha/beta hydrolase [Ignavibacteriales bacterium]|nr:alpha/beta hydrolase [Ignavibacteriales bacterium]